MLERILMWVVFLAGIALLARSHAAVGAPMGFDEARHLLNRTCFAADPDDINRFAQLTRGNQ